jgi:hypothetical protein
MRIIAQIERGKPSVAPQCLPSSKAWERFSGQLPTHCTLSCQDPIHTRTAHTELLCNSGGAETLLAEAPDLVGFDAGFRPL